MIELNSKNKLPDDWIDCAPGEGYLIKSIFLDHYGRDFSVSLNDTITEYPPSAGIQNLTSLLEEKYEAPVIITNGAKQGLFASFYALSKLGCKNTLLRKPYWCLLPASLKKERLNMVEDNYDSILSISPCNPCGRILPYNELKHQSDLAKEQNIPFIHDAAYYSHTYLPPDYTLGHIGDLQIYSASKLFGMSGWRLGYIVVNDEKYYSLLKEYMEMMTVGVSTISQSFLRAVLLEDKKHPDNKRDFIHYSFAALQEAKKKVKQIKKEVLEVPDDIETTNHGMFLWAKKGKKADFQKAKINVVGGEPFGMSGFVRINLALQPHILDEVIKRLNEA